MRPVRPDVVVLDLMLPVMDGWQFRIEQRRDPEIADTPVIAMSASTHATAGAVDADLFLSKPCSPATLVNAIEEVVAIRRRRAEPARLAQAERMAALGTLAAGIVHEINNPLTYVLLQLGRALRILATPSDAAAIDRAADARRNDQLTALVTSAVEGAERIREIARGIRTFSRVEGTTCRTSSSPSSPPSRSARAPVWGCRSATASCAPTAARWRSRAWSARAPPSASSCRVRRRARRGWSACRGSDSNRHSREGRGF